MGCNIAYVRPFVQFTCATYFRKYLQKGFVSNQELFSFEGTWQNENEMSASQKRETSEPSGPRHEDNSCKL